MFNQFYIRWGITVLVTAMAASGIAANAASAGPDQHLGADQVSSARSPAQSAASENAAAQPTTLSARSKAALNPIDVGPKAPLTRDPISVPDYAYQLDQVATAEASGAPATQFDLDSAGEMLGPPARTLFARSQSLDVTQPVSVSQLLVLDQTIGQGTRLKIMPYNALGSWYQTTDPDGPNHVALTSPETGDWTAVLPESAHALQPSLIYELTAGSFKAGQTLEIRYSRLQGAKALENPLTLPIAIQLPDALAWQVLPGEQRAFVAGPAMALQINVDQQVQINEPFTLSIQPVDALGWPSQTSTESFDLILNNRLYKEVNLENYKYAATGLILKTPGPHQFSARSPAGGLQSVTVTVWALVQPPDQLVWTDFSERSLRALIAALPISVQNGAASNDLIRRVEPLGAPAEPLQINQASRLQSMPGLRASSSPTESNRREDQSVATQGAPKADALDAALTPIAPPPAAPSSAFAATSKAIPAAEAESILSSALPRLNEPEDLLSGARADTAAPILTADRPALATANRLVQAGAGARVETVPSAPNRDRVAATGSEPNAAEALGRASADAENSWLVAPEDTTTARPEADYREIQTADNRPKRRDNGLSATVQAIEAGGQSMTLAVGDTVLNIAQPELTTDRRRQRFDLIEQAAGPSGHPWLSHHFAALGQTFGVIGGRRSFQPRTLQQGPQTAIVVRPDQTWLEALAKGQTFISSGTRAGLSFSVNGQRFGRAPHQAQRTIDIAVTSAERPLWARIYRNGELLQQLPFKAAETSATALEGLARDEKGRLFLYLESDSKPFAVGVTPPRNGREWLGQLRLEDLVLAESHTDPLAALTGHRTLQSPDQRQMDFLTWTHGSGTLMQLDLKPKARPPTPPASAAGAGRDLEGQARENPPSPGVTLELAEGYEDLTYFDSNRPPAATPSFKEQFDLEALRGQGIRRTLSVDGYLDQISLWYEDAEPDLPSQTTPPTHQITHLDRMGGRPGDYYTCQVLLRDGASLYSSPIFVGGFDPP